MADPTPLIAEEIAETRGKYEHARRLVTDGPKARRIDLVLRLLVTIYDRDAVIARLSEELSAARDVIAAFEPAEPLDGTTEADQWPPTVDVVPFTETNDVTWSGRDGKPRCARHPQVCLVVHDPTPGPPKPDDRYVCHLCMRAALRGTTEAENARLREAGQAMLNTTAPALHNKTAIAARKLMRAALDGTTEADPDLPPGVERDGDEWVLRKGSYVPYGWEWKAPNGKWVHANVGVPASFVRDVLIRPLDGTTEADR